MRMYFFAHAFVRDAFMFRLAPTIHCILTSIHELYDTVLEYICTIAHVMLLRTLRAIATDIIIAKWQN